MTENKNSNTYGKIALGGFTRDLNSPEPWLTMINEAKANEHEIKRVIIAYENSCENSIVKKLNEYCPVITIQTNGDKVLMDKLEQNGVDPQHISNLCRFDQSKDPVTEATALNQILLTALIEGMDKIMLISDGFYFNSGVDYIKHMSKPLSHGDVIASTAVPYRPDVEKILQTLQPYYLIDTFFLREYSRFIGQILMPDESAFQLLQPAKVAEYGNMFIDLSKIKNLHAFFSQTYNWKEEARIDTGAFEYFILQNQSSSVEILEVPIPSSISVSPQWSKSGSILKLISRIPFIAWNLIEMGIVRNRYSEIIDNFESKKGIISLILKEIDFSISEKQFWEYWDVVKNDLEMWILQQIVVQESWQNTVNVLSEKFITES